MVIVDAISRKYFTSETSWLWDINFDLLCSDQLQKVYLCGKYCYDLALRLSFSKLPQEKICIYEDILAACNELKGNGAEQLYAVTCFSDKDKFLRRVEMLSVGLK